VSKSVAKPLSDKYSRPAVSGAFLVDDLYYPCNERNTVAR
jgi:hypothetical protein